MANKVKRIVKLSFYQSTKSDGVFHDVPLVHKHALCDADLMPHKQFDVAILFATHLMSNVFCSGPERRGLKESHEFYGSSGGKGVNYVSPNDVADLAVRAIFEKTGINPLAHKRLAYTVTGPATITDKEVAKLISNQLGIKITYVEEPLDFFDKDTAALEKVKATGLEEEITKGSFKTVMGREPESFKDYLAATDRMCPIEKEVMASVTPKTVEVTVEVCTEGDAEKPAVAVTETAGPTKTEDSAGEKGIEHDEKNIDATKTKNTAEEKEEETGQEVEGVAKTEDTGEIKPTATDNINPTKTGTLETEPTQTDEIETAETEMEAAKKEVPQDATSGQVQPEVKAQ
eukprot:40527_1